MEGLTNSDVALLADRNGDGMFGVCEELDGAEEYIKYMHEMYSK